MLVGRYPKRWYPSRFPWNRAFLAVWWTRLVDSRLTPKPASRPMVTAHGYSPGAHLPECCNSRCNSKRQVYRALLPGVVTKGVTTETGVCRPWLTALLELQKTSVSSHRFPRCFHGIRHFLDGYRAWLQQNHGFLIGTQEGGTQLVRSKTLHTLLAQGFVPEFLESIRA